MAELSGLALCTEFTFIQQEGCMVTLKEDYSESVIFTMTFFTKIFQHPIQIRHQILWYCDHIFGMLTTPLVFRPYF